MKTAKEVMEITKKAWQIKKASIWLPHLLSGIEDHIVCMAEEGDSEAVYFYDKRDEEIIDRLLDHLKELGYTAKRSESGISIDISWS